MLHDRFDADFNAACCDLGIADPSDFPQRAHSIRISCEQMARLFATLGFVGPSTAKGAESMLGDIWRHIGGDEDGQQLVPLVNCKNFQRAILNFHHQDIVDLEREEGETEAQTARLGRLTDSGLLFTPAEIEQVTRQYQALYQNRQNRLAEIKREAHAQRSMQKHGLGKELKFRPELPKKTTALALHKRQSLQVTHNLPAGLYDRLAIESLALQVRKSELQQRRDVEKNLETPFQPQISPLKNRQGPLTARYRELQSRYHSHWDFLHSEGQHRSKTQRRDKTKDEVDLERERAEFTFRPNRKQSSMSPSKLRRGDTLGSAVQDKVI